MGKTSSISGFYKLKPEERIKLVKEFAELSDEEMEVVIKTGSLPIDMADRMIENVVGTMELPLGIAVNFQVNGKDVLVPMAVEEPSVVAAASNIAKLARAGGGFKCSATEPIMIGQIQLTGVESPFGAKMKILENREEILKRANECDPVLVKFGGGARDIEVRVLDTRAGPMVITHLLVDCRDAMGANAVNTMVESLAPFIEEITGGKVYLRILSNLAKYRLARATVTIPKEALAKGEFTGEQVVEGILEAFAFADADPFRASTHNKGIMNGIDPVIIATGNDWRAIEAGAHTYHSYEGRYSSFTRWEKDANGDLVGSIELPMAVGLIGGAVRTHPVAKANVKILGVKTASELAMICAAVGLAQNLGALKALATEGIQRGHMSLHARNTVTLAAEQLDVELTADENEKVVKQLVAEKKVRADRAQEIIKEIKGM